MAENNEQNWFALEITVESPASEAIEFALNELDSLGTEIYSLDQKKTATINVVGYFNEKPDDEIVRLQINEALRIYGFQSAAVKSLNWSEVENRDWLEEWKKHWKPTETKKFIIAPPWEKVEKSNKIVIWIEPNMAFGTGTHETTRLCLAAIEKYYRPGMSFLDVGTGTGILAIAASKLASSENLVRKADKDRQRSKSPAIELPAIKSAASVGAIAATISGCDTDEDSIKIARENATFNGAGEIDLYIGSISRKSPPFDFVCANLTADVIIPLLPLLLDKAQKLLMLSGILVEQKEIVAAKLRSLGIEDLMVKTDGQWIGLMIKK